VRDEQALLDILAEYEVEPIVVGELSVQEQLALFSSASVIVGVHGAGLTNLLFAPDDSMLIEIGGSPTTNNHYARDAINLGLDYFYVPSRRFESEIEPDFDILRAALEVGDQRLGRAWIN
jgi:capsular polysaccharide biosynthesis protein